VYQQQNREALGRLVGVAVYNVQDKVDGDYGDSALNYCRE
jgi:hypothetical protein